MSHGGDGRVYSRARANRKTPLMTSSSASYSLVLSSRSDLDNFVCVVVVPELRRHLVGAGRQRMTVAAMLGVEETNAPASFSPRCMIQYLVRTSHAGTMITPTGNTLKKSVENFDSILTETATLNSRISMAYIVEIVL